MTTARAVCSVLAFTAVAGALGVLSGCPNRAATPATGGEPAPGQAARPPIAGPGDRDYTVRGRLSKLPVAGKPPEIRATHEAIDDFLDGQGRVVGMGAMDMEFPLGPGVSASGLALGDMLEIDFSVRFDRSAGDSAPIPVWFATRLKPLPPGTPLVMREARSGQARHTLRIFSVTPGDQGAVTVTHGGIPGLLDPDGKSAPLKPGSATLRLEDGATLPPPAALAGAPADPSDPAPASRTVEVQTWWTRGKLVLAYPAR